MQVSVVVFLLYSPTSPCFALVTQHVRFQGCRKCERLQNELKRKETDLAEERSAKELIERNLSELHEVQETIKNLEVIACKVIDLKINLS